MHLFTVMEACFSSNIAINGYLTWAVRMMKSPVSTIIDTLKKDNELEAAVMKGKHAEKGCVYKRFFEAVRKNKEAGDNLREELLAVCLHILSNLPGEPDEKFCIITDDKGAAGKIDTLFRNTVAQHRGRKIVIFSTPKLLQVMWRDGAVEERECLEELLRTGTHGKITVLGTRLSDLRNREISLTWEGLAELMIQPNEINIVI